MLVFENISKHYGSKNALEDVSITFLQGKVYALVGPNGSGKSTLMKVAAGLVKTSKGNCTYNGEKIGKVTKAKIAYMSTETFYYDTMKISDVKKFHTDMFADFMPEEFDRLLEVMELTPEMKVKSLSSGMAAKLKIAVTLSRNADVIMLDEPLNGIDLIGRDQIINSVIRANRPEATIIMSSHLFGELESLVDNVVMMKNGKIILEGDIEKIREDSGKSLVDLYRETYAIS